MLFNVRPRRAARTAIARLIEACRLMFGCFDMVCSNLLTHYLRGDIANGIVTAAAQPTLSG